MLIMSQAQGCNFTVEEIEALVNYLENSSGVLHGEFSNAKKIQEEWENTAIFVNSSGLGRNRSGNQIRKKWTDLKYRIKKKEADIKHYENGT